MKYSENPIVDKSFDFSVRIVKLRISLKEAFETELWLKLFFKSEILDKKEFDSLLKDCLELIKLLTTIIKNVNLKSIWILNC